MQADPEKKRKLRISDPNMAFLKARSYCAYQERSQQEVRNKLQEWGLLQDVIEEILVKLIDVDFLNEERFAITYAGGKFRIKQWGKIKIKHALKLKGVSDYCIKKALSAIDTENYLTTLSRLIQQKERILKGTNKLAKQRKIAQSILSKGYESNLIWEILNRKE